VTAPDPRTFWRIQGWEQSSEKGYNGTVFEPVITDERFLRDPDARVLLDHFVEDQQQLHLQDAVAYYLFPVFKDYEQETHRPTYLLLSPRHGVVLITFTHSDDLARDDALLSHMYSGTVSRLIKSRLLRRDRETLKFKVTGFLMKPVNAPPIPVSEALENPYLSSYQELDNALNELLRDTVPVDVINETRSILEGAKAFSRGVSRTVPPGERDSAAAIMADLENEIFNFDIEQRKAAISVTSGPQRIRGLAGSGKTAILAMKAAHIHLKYPESTILFTFHTKSLYDLIKTSITKFYRQFAEQDPDWRKVQIMHSWGGASLPGVYHNSCRDSGVPPLRFSDIKGPSANAFDEVCSDLLSKVVPTPKYDYILMDEAQDFPSSFFTLCFYLARGDRDRKCVVWAYDELQSILNVRVRAETQLFGLDADGEPRISLTRSAGSLNLPPFATNDIVLYKSYRNAREVLVCSHAIGLGVYSDTIVQMLDSRDHWIDVGYDVIEGDFVQGSHTIVSRPQANSPLSISDRVEVDDLIQTYVARDVDEEVTWIASGVAAFLERGLQPEDILVVLLDDRNAKAYSQALSAMLREREIAVNYVAGNPFDAVHFTLPGRVTIATVYRAKGNEAAVVFAVGVDALWSDRKLRQGRNKLFTAFTRSKAWLRMSGIGEKAQFFVDELALALRRCPEIEFTYPDPDAVDMLQRDLSERSARLRQLKRQLQEINATEDELSDLLPEQK
jgi:superfamily I DNA and RNA helicase